MSDRAAYDASYEVRFTEIDHRWSATPVALFNYLQESAIAHSASVGRGPDDLIERGLGWVLTRLHLRVRRYPRWAERIRVSTWPFNLKGLHAVREFEVTDEQGRVCALATTRWVVIDVNRRRPVRIPPWIGEAYEIGSTRLIEDSFEALAPMQGGEIERRFHVRQSDLDTNQHANSANYIDWLLETVPREVIEGWRAATIEIAYKNEARAGESLLVRSAALGEGSEDEREFRHSIFREGDSAPLAEGRSQWAPQAKL